MRYDEDKPDPVEVAASSSVAFALVQIILMPLLRNGSPELKNDILKTMRDAVAALERGGAKRAAAKLRRIMRNAEAPATTIDHGPLQ